jgi:hypothetical protein
MAAGSGPGAGAFSGGAPAGPVGSGGPPGSGGGGPAGGAPGSGGLAPSGGGIVASGPGMTGGVAALAAALVDEPENNIELVLYGVVSLYERYPAKAASGN